MIADGAVRAARRPVELARDTPLHPHGDAVDLHAAVQRRSKVVFSIFVRWRWGRGGCINGRVKLIG